MALEEAPNAGESGRPTHEIGQPRAGLLQSTTNHTIDSLAGPSAQTNLPIGMQAGSLQTETREAGESPEALMGQPESFPVDLHLDRAAEGEVSGGAAGCTLERDHGCGVELCLDPVLELHEQVTIRDDLEPHRHVRQTLHDGLGEEVHPQGTLDLDAVDEQPLRFDVDSATWLTGPAKGADQGQSLDVGGGTTGEGERKLDGAFVEGEGPEQFSGRHESLEAHGSGLETGGPAHDGQCGERTAFLDQLDQEAPRRMAVNGSSVMISFNRSSSA